MFHGWYELPWWSVTFPSLVTGVTGSIQVHRGQNKKLQEDMALSFPLKTQGRWDFWNAQTGDERWIAFILTFSDFCLQHYQLPLPVICFKNVHYRWRPFRDNLQNAAPNSNYHKKVQVPVFSSQFLCYYTRCLFNFLPDIRLISGLMGAIALAT